MTTRSIPGLSPRSADEVAVAGIADGPAPLQVAAQAPLQALAGPVALNALLPVDDGGDLGQRGTGVIAIESDQGIAQPQGLGRPTGDRRVGRCGEEAFQSRQPLCDGRDGVALVDASAQDDRVRYGRRGCPPTTRCM